MELVPMTQLGDSAERWLDVWRGVRACVTQYACRL